MILTQELLDATNACRPGVDKGIELNCIGLDCKDVIQILENNNCQEYAIWINGLYSNQTALKISKYYEYIQYLIYDPIENHFKSTPNESDISAIKEQIILDNPEIQQSLIIAYEEIKSLDGSVYRFPIH
jgi:hypothetical protein